MNFILNFYRQLPWFRGKLRLGTLLFKRYLNQSGPVSFLAHHNLQYHIPNTKENVGVELYINGVYERDIVSFLQKNIPDGAVFFDIGANIGSVGLPIVKRKKGINYFGFEASPIVFEYLRRNFEANEILKFELHNKLVHRDDYQTLKFYQSELYGKSSLAPTYSNDFIFIDSLCLDSFCKKKKIDRINWIKVDVQGFELFVFEGMRELLSNKKVDNILFEFEGWAEDQAGVTPGSAKQLLQDLGYELYTLSGAKYFNATVNQDTMLWARPKNVTQ